MSHPMGATQKSPKGLNPCCNGICSVRPRTLKTSCRPESFNPCCNGICSVRRWAQALNRKLLRLNPCCNGICSVRAGGRRPAGCFGVLILVVMEYVL